MIKFVAYDTIEEFHYDKAELVSINVGKVQTYENDWTTAFFKYSVDGKVAVTKTHVEGDEQHHKKYHGGLFRPILAYTERVKKTGRTGWYMSVINEGYVETGMPIILLERPFPNWTITTVHEIYSTAKS